MWYDNVDASMIRMMKNNTLSHRMLKLDFPDVAEVFEQVPVEELIYLNPQSEWQDCMLMTPCKFSEGTFRLRSDWERPLRWEGEVELKRRGGWNVLMVDSVFNEEVNDWPEGRYRMVVERGEQI